MQPWSPGSLFRSNFNASQPTVIYIHGYSERSPGSSGAAIKNGKFFLNNFLAYFLRLSIYGISTFESPLSAYLFRNNFNVILVDWSKLAPMPWYHKAVRNTRIVGPHVAATLRWLESLGAFRLRRVHVVGFSLGAEVAGFMGKALFPRRVSWIYQQ